MDHCSDRKTQINEKVKIGLYPKWGFSTLKGETGKFIRSNTQLKKAGSLSEFHIPEDSKERAKNSLQFSLNSNMHFELEYFSGYQMYRINQGAFNPAMNFKTEFRICLYCGTACKTTGKQSPKEEKHLNPFNGKNCPGSTSQALPSSLISIFDTDIVKLNFKDLPAYRYTNQTNDFEYRSFWRTLLYALLESMSHIMNIERNDLNGKVHYNINKMPTLILMDTVAGGAGHVARLIGRGGEDPQQLLNDIMAEAIHILDCKDCPEDAACYSCLFHHSNQKYHHSLNRGLVRQCLYQNT